MFCTNCGIEMSNNALACPKCGEPTKNAVQLNRAKSRVVYCLLAFFFGGLGVHNFYVGRWRHAVGELVSTILVIPALYGFIAAMSHSDAERILPIGYGFMVLIVIAEMITIKKDGKGVPFAGYENA